MYQNPNHQYGQQPAGDWRTTQPQQEPHSRQQPLPSIEFMANPRALPAMHGMNGMNGYHQGAYAPQGYYPSPQPQMPPRMPSQMPLQMPPQMPPQMPQMVQEVQQPNRVTQPMELSRSGSNDKYRFSLKVVQQPQRARMCGFGDKDRRPITPPPCVRLHIHDFRGKEIDPDTVNGAFFVMTVDLWNEKADREANIVRASNTASPSASISTATTTSFPPAPDRPSLGGVPSQYPMDRSYIDGSGMMYGTPQSTNGAMGALPSMPYAYPSVAAVSQPNSPSMFTRNLIGSLTVNAAKLTDEKHELGYWFVLQDLSVRTEGHFRLRFTFIDVGIATSASANGPSLNRGRAPVLAHVFSEPFQVYSAKKFPGVIESTALSKTFARQGVKIPIRKDTREGKDEDDDDDDV